MIPPLPPGWTERTEWDSQAPEAIGRLALCRFAARRITYYPRWWLAPVWPLIRPLVQAHERGHAHGIPASGCLGGHSWCIMAEESGGVDSWLGKAALWPGQLLTGMRFCPECQERIDE